MDKLQRLEAAKEKVEELSKTKERLSGVLETKKSLLEELEKKAKAEFDCEVHEIPDLVEKLDSEATAALEKAERLLAPPAKVETIVEPDDEDEDEDAIP